MLKVTAQANNSAEILLYDVITDFTDEEWGFISAKGLIDKVKALGNITNITLRINSLGGDIFEAQAMYSYLKTHPANITVMIDGIAASAASVVAMSGNKIIMPENALLMIHNPAGGVYGEAEDMRDSAEILDKVRDAIANVYIARTGLERDKVIEMMNAETWLSAQEAKALKFCDEISEPIKIAARANISNIKNQLLLNTATNTANNLKEEAKVMPENQEIRTIADLQNAYPELVNTLRDSAIQGERERLRTLDSLNAPGREAIIARAKYEEPKDARDIAIELLQADKSNAQINAMHQDAQAVNAALTPQKTTPDAQAESDRAATLIANHINSMRGYK